MWGRIIALHFWGFLCYHGIYRFIANWIIIVSSRGDGVTSAFSKLRPIWISHLYYFFPKNGKIKMTKKMAKRNGHHWHHLTRQPLAPICFSN